jgi:hypothetical protein
LRANKVRTIPDGTEYVMGSPFGVESIFVIASDKPLDMRGFLREFKNAVKQDNGTFNGNESTGTFTIGNFSGKYNVTGTTIDFSFQHPVEESLSRGVPSKTRGISGAYNFSFSKPPDITQAVQTVRNGIEAKGGSFSGNENTGSFKASGISGNYNIENVVAVTILEKPFVIPNSMIETEVKKFFGIK